MTGFTCWFCGEVIEPEDMHAVQISVSSLWLAGGATQTFTAHSICATARLAGFAMQFNPQVLE